MGKKKPLEAAAPPGTVAGPIALTDVDPHKDCPPPVWGGVFWECRNHHPPMEVVILREAPTAPSDAGRRPRGVAPVARPGIDRDLYALVTALEIKLTALAESHAKLVATVDAMKSS